ncbi:MAG: hypothetical protein WKG07_27965 [Hymenobacter sp.]
MRVTPGPAHRDGSHMIDRLQEAIEARQRVRNGSKFSLWSPTSGVAVDMFSRRFQIEPKTFINKMKEFELDVCSAAVNHANPA